MFQFRHQTSVHFQLESDSCPGWERLWLGTGSRGTELQRGLPWKHSSSPGMASFIQVRCRDGTIRGQPSDIYRQLCSHATTWPWSWIGSSTDRTSCAPWRMWKEWIDVKHGIYQSCVSMHLTLDMILVHNTMWNWISVTQRFLVAQGLGQYAELRIGRSPVPPFQSNPQKTSQSCSRYQLNQLGSKAALESTLDQ